MLALPAPFKQTGSACEPSHLAARVCQLLDDSQATEGHVQLAVAPFVHSHHTALAVALGCCL